MDEINRFKKIVIKFIMFVENINRVQKFITEFFE